MSLLGSWQSEKMVQLQCWSSTVVHKSYIYVWFIHSVRFHCRMLIVPMKAKVLDRNGSSYSPPSLPFALGQYLIWTCAGLVCATTVSISSYVHQCCCFWKTLFSWGHLSCMILTNSLRPLPKAKEMELMKLSCI